MVSQGQLFTLLIIASELGVLTYKITVHLSYGRKHMNIFHPFNNGHNFIGICPTIRGWHTIFDDKLSFFTLIFRYFYG
jgi:hypothetical protein